MIGKIVALLVMVAVYIFYGIWWALGVAVGVLLIWRYYVDAKDRKIEQRIAREQSEEKLKFESDQVARGLVKFVDELGGVSWGSPAQVLQWKTEMRKRLETTESIKAMLSSGFRIPRIGDKEFLSLVEEIFRVTGYPGADGSERTLMLTILKSYGSVDDDDVLEFLSRLQAKNYTRGILATNLDFTNDAKERAAPLPITLVTGDQLVEKIRSNPTAFTDYLGKLLEKREEARSTKDQWNARLDMIDPKGFQILVGALFRKMGYSVKELPFSRDFGADLIVEKGGEKRVIQCKRFQKGNLVGAPLVRNTLGALHKYQAPIAVLVTTSFFTVEAEEQAKNAPIELWNRTKLIDLLGEYQPNSNV